LLQGAAKASQEMGGGFGKLPGKAPGGASIVTVSDKVTRGVEMRKESQRCVTGFPDSDFELLDIPCFEHRSGIGL
jgi:hypothetical protein